MKEHVFSINNFNMPKVYEKSDAGYILIVRLLLLEPGTFQSHRNMGVGLKSRYRYNSESDFLRSLQNDIKQQIASYLPELIATDIRLTLKGKSLGIIINTDDGAYVLSYNSETDELDTAASYILNDLN